MGPTRLPQSPRGFRAHAGGPFPNPSSRGSTQLPHSPRSVRANFEPRVETLRPGSQHDPRIILNNFASVLSPFSRQGRK
eukprot:1085984-Pyramimonas_sp.AAC.1